MLRPAIFLDGGSRTEAKKYAQFNLIPRVSHFPSPVHPPVPAPRRAPAPLKGGKMRDPGNEVEKYSVKISGDGANMSNMADSQENFSGADLRDEETVLAIRLAEALRTDEVETFLEIYDSIPSTTETKRVSILISFTTSSRILLLLLAIEKVKIFTNSIVTFFLRIFHVLTRWKKKETFAVYGEFTFR